MKKADVVIIGGSAAGMVAAVTGKSSWNDKSFILVKKQKDMMVPCGIPYIFGTLESSQQNIMPVDTMLAKSDVESLVNEVVAIDKEAKTVTLDDGQLIGYDKLVMINYSNVFLCRIFLLFTHLKQVFTPPILRTATGQINSGLPEVKFPNPKISFYPLII